MLGGRLGDTVAVPSGAAEWEGASSLDLLSRAYAQVREAGFELANADCVLVGEEPKIASVRGAMQTKLAEAMGVEPGRVNVRATTTDRHGFTGRGEGLAAVAVALSKTVRSTPRFAARFRGCAGPSPRLRFTTRSDANGEVS